MHLRIKSLRYSPALHALLRGAFARECTHDALLPSSHAYALAKSRRLRKARRALPPAARCIPSRSGTFYSPCELRAEDLDACEDILLDSLRAPKVLQVPRAPLGEMALARSSGVLDMQDFGGSARAKRESGAAEEVQTREHTFTIARDGVLNCLGVFIWVDLGVGAPAKISDEEIACGGGAAR